MKMRFDRTDCSSERAYHFIRTTGKACVALRQRSGTAVSDKGHTQVDFLPRQKQGSMRADDVWQMSPASDRH